MSARSACRARAGGGAAQSLVTSSGSQAPYAAVEGSRGRAGRAALTRRPLSMPLLPRGLDAAHVLFRLQPVDPANARHCLPPEIDLVSLGRGSEVVQIRREVGGCRPLEQLLAQ